MDEKDTNNRFTHRKMVESFGSFYTSRVPKIQQPHNRRSDQHNTSYSRSRHLVQSRLYHWQSSSTRDIFNITRENIKSAANTVFGSVQISLQSAHHRHLPLTRLKLSVRESVFLKEFDLQSNMSQNSVNVFVNDFC